ncbi:MAG: M3 family oligoendopeptidase, partial [Lachnospiraceae bacterium]|nr:M3 family oligoendopeptidase [Lachnospiraceae bacterium]
LDPIYKGLEDPAYEADMQAVEKLIAEFAKEVKEAGAAEECTERLLLLEEELVLKISKLGLYLSLRQSVEAENGEVMAQDSRLMKMYSQLMPFTAAADKIFAKIEDIDGLAKTSEVVKEYTFLLKQAKEHAKYLLSDDVEEIISAMDMTGGSAWNQLQSFLTSTVKVDYEEKVVTLSEIRNMAYDADQAVRKAAYEAELACYEKIQDSIAFALNNIKNQVTFLCHKRGYESPLAMTLKQSRMTKETLDAMLEAIKEYLPTFRKYLRKKAEMLGHENGLPFYELFAPLGKSDKKFSVEEARDYLVNCFKTFTQDMSDMMQEAFDNEWIDFFPRKGKRGGAFCAGVPGMKESRILTNYDGNFGAVSTLAHELGHAFHNRQTQDNRALNQDYSMPVAETASTFNETHLGHFALATATPEEKLALLENDLMEKTQCIVDIYSRFLFESAVFEKSQSKFLMAEDLKAMMLDAQRQAYGEGLDENYLHPYMWVCKGHYYSSGLSFYNFPYAFGNLFAVGLYNMFLEEGESFVPKYKAMLKATPTCTIEEAGAMMGVDLSDKKFWESSLALIAKDIEAFCALIK